MLQLCCDVKVTTPAFRVSWNSPKLVEAHKVDEPRLVRSSSHFHEVVFINSLYHNNLSASARIDFRYLPNKDEAWYFSFSFILFSSYIQENESTFHNNSSLVAIPYTSLTPEIARCLGRSSGKSRKILKRELSAQVHILHSTRENRYRL